MKPWKRILLVGAMTFALLVILLEILSRIADGRVERRIEAGEPALPKEPGFFDKLSSAYVDPASQKNSQARTLPHPYLGYMLKPSWSTPAGSIQQCSHNSLGFRGKETTWEKPANTIRIVVIGGSSVYGQSESSDETAWLARLEAHLNEGTTKQHVEVINGGAPGYNSFEMLINLETRLMDFHPDLVLVYEAINDMRVALYTRGGDVQHDNTHWRATWPVDRPSSLERFFEHSHAYLIWRHYFTDYDKLRPDLGYWAIRNYDPTGDPYFPNPVPELGFTTYRRNLESIIAVARAGNAQVVIATQPLARYHLDLHGSRILQLAGIDRIQSIEREVAKERSVTVIESARVVEAAVQQELEAEIDRQRGLDPKAETAELELRAKRDLHPDKPPIKRDGVIFRAEVHPYDFGAELIAKTVAQGLFDAHLIPR